MKRHACLVVLLASGTIATAGCSSKSGAGRATTPAPVPATRIDHSAAANKERDTAIGRLQSVGVLGEVSCKAGGATVVVQPTFFEASAGDQAGFANLVYQQCFSGSDPAASLSVLDNENQIAARYDPTQGLVVQKR